MKANHAAQAGTLAIEVCLWGLVMKPERGPEPPQYDDPDQLPNQCGVTNALACVMNAGLSPDDRPKRDEPGPPSAALGQRQIDRQQRPRNSHPDPLGQCARYAGRSARHRGHLIDPMRPQSAVSRSRDRAVHMRRDRHRAATSADVGSSREERRSMISAAAFPRRRAAIQIARLFPGAPSIPPLRVLVAAFAAAARQASNAA